MAAAAKRVAIRALKLAEARQRRGLSLKDISESTKISLRFLEAIEAEEFEKLPGGVFTVNYLKQYAAAIGYPEEDLVRRGRAALATREPAEPAAASPGLLRSLLGLQIF